MGRIATKASSNVWYQARMQASKYNDKLASREGASEILGMSVSAISDAELGISKVMPVDKAVLMADYYNAPHLKNYYCKHECPIGKEKSLAVELDSIERATIRLVKALDHETIHEVKKKLLEIAEDGQISDDEIPSLDEIGNCLNKLSKHISSLSLIVESVKNDRSDMDGIE